jgi:hypothetical protein
MKSAQTELSSTKIKINFRNSFKKVYKLKQFDSPGPLAHTSCQTTWQSKSDSLAVSSKQRVKKM